MDVAIDQERFDATVRELLALQTPKARAGLLELLAIHEIKVWTNDGRDETWTFTVDGVAFGRVHRSRIEAAPARPEDVR